MTTPTLQVLLDDASNGGTFPYDISAYVRFAPGVKAAPAGRPDEQSSLSPGSLELTLNNADGRFTFGSTSGGYGAINLKRRIRVRATANGVTTTLFTGPVMSWPVVWESGSVNAFSAVSAVDVLADAERRVLRSVIEEEILVTAPTFYYPAGEPDGAASVGDASGNASPSLTGTGSGASYKLGQDTGPGTDGLSAPHFNGGTFLGAVKPLIISGASGGAMAVAFNIASAPAAAVSIAGYFAGANGGQLHIVMGTDGKIRLCTAADPATAQVTSPSAYADGATHVVVISGDVAIPPNGTWNLYVDGTLVATLTSGFGAQLNGSGFPVLGGAPASAWTATVPMAGTACHFAGWNRELTSTEIGNISSAMLTGFTGENAGARLTRLAGYGQLPTGSIATGSPVGFKDFTGQSLADALREVAQTDGGILGISGLGALTYVGRNVLASAASPDLTCPSAWLDGSVQPVVDDQRLVNYITVTTDTGAASVATNTSAVSAYGRYPQARDYLVDDLQSAVDRGNWEVAQNAQPTPRVGTLAFNGLARSAAEQAQLLALKPGSWIRITGLPTQFPGGSTADFIVEGLSHDLSADAWGIAVNVVSRSIYGPAWTLGDSTNGVLGSTTRLFY